MNEIRQHIPAFVETEKGPEVMPFETLDELLVIPWVKRWREFPRFHQFSQSDRHLMAEFRGGREWWVVGLLSNPVEGLPVWDHGIYEVWENGIAKDIPGTEVSSSGGNVVTLRDGRQLKRRE